MIDGIKPSNAAAASALSSDVTIDTTDKYDQAN
jgi:hypothetical protein